MLSSLLDGCPRIFIQWYAFALQELKQKKSYGSRGQGQDYSTAFCHWQTPCCGHHQGKYNSRSGCCLSQRVLCCVSSIYPPQLWSQGHKGKIPAVSFILSILFPERMSSLIELKCPILFWFFPITNQHRFSRSLFFGCKFRSRSFRKKGFKIRTRSFSRYFLQYFKGEKFPNPIDWL